MSWRIDKQANGKFAIYSTRIDDYIVIDADELEIAQIYAEKGVKVYLASARAQMTTRVTPVTAEGEVKIEASRRRAGVFSASVHGSMPGTVQRGIFSPRAASIWRTIGMSCHVAMVETMP